MNLLWTKMHSMSIGDNWGWDVILSGVFPPGKKSGGCGGLILGWSLESRCRHGYNSASRNNFSPSVPYLTGCPSLILMRDVLIYGYAESSCYLFQGKLWLWSCMLYCWCGPGTSLDITAYLSIIWLYDWCTKRIRLTSELT